LNGDGGASRAGNSEVAELQAPLPLGALCLPGLRWILRRHNLEDDEATRFLLREYILSAWNVALEFSSFLDVENPSARLLFSMASSFRRLLPGHISRQRGLRVITHEVGLQPASAFFTEGEATAYPISMPEEFELDSTRNARLDSYLEQRFQGRFSMVESSSGRACADWMQTLWRRPGASARSYHLYKCHFRHEPAPCQYGLPDMFAWLELVLTEIKSHPDALFVVRAHRMKRASARRAVRPWKAGWRRAAPGCAKM